jgi:hypothetical protein
VAIALLVGITGFMTPVAAGHYNKIRSAIGQKAPRDKTDAPPPVPLPPEQLELLLMAPTPWILVAVGGIGFAAILALMMFKPF